MPQPLSCPLRFALFALLCAIAPASLAAVVYPTSPIERTKDGWTNFQPSADSKGIFVAENGDDQNDGSMEHPVRTAVRAQRLARDGSPDWIFFRRGDTFGPLGQWKKSGRSPREPMVLTAYGTGPRPVVGNISTARDKVVGSVALVSLHLTAPNRDTTRDDFDKKNVDQRNGVDWSANGDVLYIEDCRIDWFLYNITILGKIQPIIRRNVIADSWVLWTEKNKSTKSQGIYLSTKGTPYLLEENVLDHNGWNDKHTPKDSATFMFSHNVYCAEGSGPGMVRGNLISRAASIGLQMRSGGEMRDNVFIDNRGAGFVSRIKADPTQPAVISGNVITDSATGIGLGFELIRTDIGVFENNLIINKKKGAGGSPALNINPITRSPFASGDPPAAPAEHAKLTIRDNIIYKFQSVNAYLGRDVDLTMTGNTIVPIDGGKTFCIVNGVLPTQHTLQNHYGSNGDDKPFQFGSSMLTFDEWKQRTGEAGDMAPPNFPDPNRDVASYMKSLNREGGVAAFLEEARKMERGINTAAFSARALADYLRRGFTAAAPAKHL
jgi:hypothetical protein